VYVWLCSQLIDSDPSSFVFLLARETSEHCAQTELFLPRGLAARRQLPAGDHFTLFHPRAVPSVQRWWRRGRENPGDEYLSARWMACRIFIWVTCVLAVLWCSRTTFCVSNLSLSLLVEVHRGWWYTPSDEDKLFPLWFAFWIFTVLYAVYSCDNTPSHQSNMTSTLLFRCAPGLISSMMITTQWQISSSM